jgi:hypothetical protein
MKAEQQPLELNEKGFFFPNFKAPNTSITHLNFTE